jgi:hypothetical protein
VFLDEGTGRKGEPVLLKTLELLVGPSYERSKVKPFEALVGRKCPPEDLPEGTLARHTGLKALQLDEGTERRMAPHLAVQFQAAGLLQQPGASRLERRGIDAERTHHGAKRLSVVDDLPVQSLQEVAELSTSILCSGTARKLNAQPRSSKVIVQVDIERAHREHECVLPGAATL